MSNTHSEVAHHWAHQTGRKTRGFNLFYDGPAIYSHGLHYRIATIVTAPADGEPVVLISTRGYSVSTGAHTRIVEGAVSHMRTIHVPTLDQGSHGPAEHREGLLREASDLCATAARRRSDNNRRWDLRQANGKITDANRLNELFSLGFPEVTLTTLPDAILTISEVIRERDLVRQARLQAQQEDRRRLDDEALAAWCRGEDVRLPYLGVRAEGALLRVKGDTLETSLGASVPLAHAIKAFGFIKGCRDAGREWHRNGHTIHVGHFQVDHIAASGSINAGCHYIGWPEIERIAREVGAFDVAGPVAEAPTDHVPA